MVNVPPAPFLSSFFFLDESARDARYFTTMKTHAVTAGRQRVIRIFFCVNAATKATTLLKFRRRGRLGS